MEERRSKTVRHKPKPRYVRPLVETFPTTPPDTPSSFDSTRNIRTAVFQEWYAARLETKKKELREKKQKEKEEEEKKQKVTIAAKLYTLYVYSSGHWYKCCTNLQK